MRVSVSDKPAWPFSAEYGSKGQRKPHPTSMGAERPKMCFLSQVDNRTIWSHVWQVKVTKMMSGWMTKKSWFDARVIMGYRYRETHRPNGFWFHLRLPSGLQPADWWEKLELIASERQTGLRLGSRVLLPLKFLESRTKETCFIKLRLTYVNLRFIGAKGWEQVVCLTCSEET